MRLGLSLSLLGLLTWACEPVAEPTPDNDPAEVCAQTAALSLRDIREASWRGSQCGCGEDFECRVLCDYGEQQQQQQEQGLSRGDFSLPDLDDCPVCGRETGFLDAPILEIEVIGDRGVNLRWAEVEDASFYVVHAIQLDNLPKIISMRRTDTYQLEETQLNLKLNPGFRYVFFVIAWSDDENKRRSPPSEPVGIAL